eukprot:TRINITY_DN742_c0_g1_i1.p1 TRINITY_DN742_c0_g1~~TRINITY_DN742_c0_g1_i1.p1  ORF type:complete len:136 (+),score=25.18 TRINITY_DN742_c0_g1_i1:372-779(+)
MPQRKEYGSVIDMAKDIKANIVKTYNKPASSFTSWPTSRRQASPVRQRPSRPTSLDSSPRMARAHMPPSSSKIPSFAGLKSMRIRQEDKLMQPSSGIMAQLNQHYNPQAILSSTSLASRRRAGNLDSIAELSAAA